MSQDSDTKKEYRQLCNLIIQLDQISKSFWRKENDLLGENLKNKTVRNYLKLPYDVHRISGIELENKVRKSSRYPYLKINKHIYLPPIGKGKDSEYIPTLTTNCILQDNTSTCYYLELYRYLGNVSLKLHGFGFRFEKHPSSKHDYGHVQVTNGPRGITLPKCPSWIPEHVPCIPITGENSITLLNSLLLSIYGKDSFIMLCATLNIDKEYVDPLMTVLQ